MAYSKPVLLTRNADSKRILGVCGANRGNCFNPCQTFK